MGPAGGVREDHFARLRIFGFTEEAQVGLVARRIADFELLGDLRDIEHGYRNGARLMPFLKDLRLAYEEAARSYWFGYWLKHYLADVDRRLPP